MRKTQIVTADCGRDKGKVFKITELSAFEAHDWLAKAFFAVMNAGNEISQEVAAQGISGLISLGFDSLRKVRYEDAEPLIKVLQSCIVILPDHKNKQIERPLIDSDIEEYITLVQLEKQVFDLHLEAVKTDAPSTSEPQGATAA